MPQFIDDALGLLGLKVRDKITGIEGVITSICFDLYGCVQAAISRGLDKDGKPYDNWWYDVQRLAILAPEPVMIVPDFKSREVALPQYDAGPAEKAPARF